MNILRRNGNVREQRLAGHAVIAERIVWPDVAFVAPENVDEIPWRLVAIAVRGGPHRVELLGGVAAGERDAKFAALRDCVFHIRYDFLQDGVAQRVQIRRYSRVEFHEGVPLLRCAREGDSVWLDAPDAHYDECVTPSAARSASSCAKFFT